MSNTKEPENVQKQVTASSTDLGKKRRLKIGALSVISTVIVILAVIAINYFIDYVAERYVLEIDMTEESEYEISDETIQMLQTMDEPVTFTILANQTDYENDADLRRLPKIFQRYAQLSEGMITVKYINAVTNPEIFSQYDDLGDLSSGDIIVESEKRYKSMNPHDLLEYTSASSSSGSSSDTAYVTGLRAEQRLTSAVLYVTANKAPKAAYITGHQEKTNLDTFESLLGSSNYEISNISLMEVGEIPSDVDMVIISEPKGDYTTDEIEILDKFLNDSGKMIVSFASDTPDLPNLEEYFEEWGIAYDDQLVYDTERCYAGYNMYLLPNIVTVEKLTDNLSNSGYVIIPGARSIETLWSQDNWRGTQPLFTTSESSYAKSLTSEVTALEKTADDESGPFNVGVMSYQNKVNNLESNFSYILFLNAGMLSDSTLGGTSFLNSDYMMNALNFISDDSESVIIPSKDLTSANLVVTGAARKMLYYLLIFVIPGVCLVLGVMVWLRRRHK